VPCQGLPEPFDMRRVIGEKACHPEEAADLVSGPREYYAITAIFGSANFSECGAFAKE
jgi:hypothetical protein